MPQKFRVHEIAPHVFSRYAKKGNGEVFCVKCGDKIAEGDLVITRSNKHESFIYCPRCAYYLYLLSSFGAVSFKGMVKRGAFYNLILNGEKRQTIREPMKNGRPHVKKDHTFKLYWKIRMKRAKKKALDQPHRIGIALCTAYEDVTLADMWWDEENAIADGFSSLDEFRDWFDPSPYNYTWKRYDWKINEDILKKFPYKRIKWHYPLLERG